MKINKTQFSIDSRKKEIGFFIKRSRGHFFKYIMNRFRWYWYPRFRYTSRFPDHVDIESTNACNMRCPMCYRYRMKNLGFMDFNIYKKIIDECSSHKIYSIRLSWRGEPLLHPKIIDMIKYAKNKGISEVSFLTNGLLLEKLKDKLIEAGPDWITLSFDGLGDTYEKIRRPAKYNDMLRSIKNFQKRKKEKGKIKPVLKVQTIWTAIENNPRKYFEVFDPIVDKISANPTKNYHAKTINHDPNFICPKPWQRIVISWNGNVVQCIADTEEKNVVGNVKNKTIKEIWHDEKLKNVRKLHSEKKRLKLLPCSECHEGSKMKKIKIEVGEKRTVEMFDDGNKNR